MNIYKGFYRAYFVWSSSQRGLNVVPKGSVVVGRKVCHTWLCQVAILYESFQNGEVRHSRILHLKHTYLDVSLYESSYSVFLSTKSLCSSPRCGPFLWQFGGHDWLSSMANNEVLLALCDPHCLYGECWSELHLTIPNYCLWVLELWFNLLLFCIFMCFGFKGLIGKWTGHITQNTKHILNTAECFVCVFFCLFWTSLW